MVNIENLESVKSTVQSNFKICLIINIESFHNKEISQIFYKSVQLVYKLKDHHNDFPDFSRLSIKSILRKLETTKMYIREKLDSESSLHCIQISIFTVIILSQIFSCP